MHMHEVLKEPDAHKFKKVMVKEVCNHTNRDDIGAYSDHSLFLKLARSVDDFAVLFTER